ncbi:hypothetical protein I4U23_030054 [Adineta vaga]|nr:hypothetical protein I4U23_030054 [Adineta vaga]
MSTFHYLSRRKRRDFRSNHLIREQENHIHSTGDASFVSNLLVQPLSVIHYDDYLYLIYLFLLMIFYTCYITMILQDKINLFDDNEQYYYFDNYERQIPRLLWFRKGHNFC